MRNLLRFLILSLLSVPILTGCPDETTTYEPVAFQWSTVMENPAFGFRKMWDLGDNSDNVPLRIAAKNMHFGNVFYYKPDTSAGGEGDKHPYVATGEIYDVSGLKSSHIWCAANKETGEGYVYTYDGSFYVDALKNYDSVIFAATGKITKRLWAVHVFEDRDTNKETRVFVGDDGYVLHYVEDSGTPSGGCAINDWHAYTIPSAPDLRGVWGVDSQHLWAVGKLGAIYQYSGGFSWTKIDNGLTSYHLYDIFGLTSGSTAYWYAVGEYGTMLYYNNGNLSIVTGLPSSSSNLHAIFLRSATSGIAVGQNGLILELGPLGWQEIVGITYRDCYGCFISKDLKNKYLATSNDTTWESTLIRYYEP